MKVESIEQICQFFEKNGIQSENNQIEGKLNRVIEFTIEGEKYYIEWWINQSYLKFKNEISAPHIPFKFISIDNYSLTLLHNEQLCFYDIENIGNNKSMFYNHIPFGCLKIPFNRSKK